MEIPKNWTFKDLNVVRGFDSHVREQLPWYDLASEAVCTCIRGYLPEGGFLYDIGCSTGNITKRMKDVLKYRSAKVVNIDSSKDMFSAFEGYGETVVQDATIVNYENYDVAVLFLTLMFIPVKHRNALLKTLKEQLNDGGVLIVVDKIEGDRGYFSNVMDKITLNLKQETTTPEDIFKKEMSLLGIQRPLKRKELQGFIPFFKFGEFEGSVYLKEGH